MSSWMTPPDQHLHEQRQVQLQQMIQQQQQQHQQQSQMEHQQQQQQQFQQPSHYDIVKNQQHQAQLDQLSAQMGSLGFQEMANLRNNNPFDQGSKRLDPVYASMASHFQPTAQAMEQEGQSVKGGFAESGHHFPHHQLLKRTEIMPRCNIHWM